ncbi:MAG: hypothetical protein NVS1B16_07340 [Pseudarthrobacter sp.]
MNLPAPEFGLRAYLLCPTPAGRAAAGKWAVERQLLDPDTYRVAYAYEGPDAFSYAWDVSGPRKDLLLTSLLRRLY